MASQSPSPCNDSHIGVKTYRIFFTSDDGISFEFIPLKAYKVFVYTVIIYKLTSYRQGDEVESATIPYYVSDGETNGLNADLIFPFSSFNEQNPERLIAPYSDVWGRGTLYKYRVAENLRFDLRIDDSSRLHERGGLQSVLPRLVNLLDFIICILSSDKVNESIVFNLPSFRPTAYYRELERTGSVDDIIVRDDNNRGRILEYMYNFKTELYSHKNFFKKFERCFIIIEEKSIEDFNDEYGQICSNEGDLNFQRYKQISDGFYNVFKRSLDYDVYRLRRQSLFRSILLPVNNLNIQNLRDHICSGFQAHCDRETATRLDRERRERLERERRMRERRMRERLDRERLDRESQARYQREREQSAEFDIYEGERPRKRKETSYLPDVFFERIPRREFQEENSDSDYDDTN